MPRRLASNRSGFSMDLFASRQSFQIATPFSRIASCSASAMAVYRTARRQLFYCNMPDEIVLTTIHKLSLLSMRSAGRIPDRFLLNLQNWLVQKGLCEIM
jgi:hypothetical protein